MAGARAQAAAQGVTRGLLAREPAPFTHPVAFFVASVRHPTVPGTCLPTVALPRRAQNSFRTPRVAQGDCPWGARVHGPPPCHPDPKTNSRNTLGTVRSWHAKRTRPNAARGCSKWPANTCRRPKMSRVDEGAAMVPATVRRSQMIPRAHRTSISSLETSELSSPP
jgi:hypothetical protein